MYLKTLTLRGFKSFASATSLRFEPGITCVVGPNGSGKSNVVDAFSWVMGEQGVKTLRGGKMEDVVFAGTASRAPLGRAEVTLTIDNSDGALPIEYAEVTISRLLFRSGQSEYAINGDHCRLLDVQELLSDSGLGREMHVIVGQGQLDQVLHAGPEARRALIEEAAGVLKHRRRKEKALRKLEAMQANLTRLVDLTAELRRRLKPLGRQAAIARRAAFIQADLRDARLRLLADDYVTAASQLERGETDEAAAMARRAALEQELAQARRQEAALEAAEQQHAPSLAVTQETWFALSALAERLRGVASLAEERHKHLAAEPEQARPGRDPDELEREAADLREQEVALGERMEAARERLADTAAQRAGAEEALTRLEHRLAEDARAASQRAERLARLRGQVGAARSRTAAGQEEADRLAASFEQARARAEQAEQDQAQVQGVSSGRDVSRADLVAAHDQAGAALAEISARVARLRGAERQASGQRAALLGRRDALEEGLQALRSGKDAATALLEDPQRSAGVLGAVAALLTVDDGAQEAITAALGAAADAVAVAGLDAAVAILAELKAGGAGSAGLVIAGDPGDQPARLPGRGQEGADLPAGVVPAVDLVKAPGELALAVAALLDDVVVAGDLAGARELLRARPALRVVTRDGDLLGAHWAHGGSARPPSVLTMRAAVDEAAAGLGQAERGCEQAASELAAAIEAEQEARQAARTALDRMQEADAAAAEISGRLGRLAGAARAARDEANRLAAAIAAAERAREKDLAQLGDLEQQLASAEATAEAGPTAATSADDDFAAAGSDAAGSGSAGMGAVDRDTLAGQVAVARNAEMEARLEVRTAEERLRAIAGRADALAASAAAERAAADRALARRRLRTRQAVVARAVAGGARLALDRLAESLAVATAQRQAAEQASQGRAERLKAVRVRVRELAADFDAVVDSAHGAEIARAGHRMRLEQLAGRAAEEFGVEAADLVAEYGPDVLIPALVEVAEGPAEPGAGPVRAAEGREEAAGIDGQPTAAGGQAAGIDGQPTAAGGQAAGGRQEAAGGPVEAGYAAEDPGQAAGGPAGREESQENGARRPVDPAAGQRQGPVDPGAREQQSPVRPGARQLQMPVDPAAGPPERPPAPYVRAEQERRAAAAQRQLDQLGKVNPLALEEFAALEERHAFLATQVEDLKKTRRDLLTVVKEVDDRVLQVFTAAFEDTAREFEEIFGRLFPGGEGRLVLTEPDDLLATGIDFEARPPGKKVKRLSLLSGGERSLTAIAYLLAIFKARPSPFYVLDEVEAALDDTNLQRLLLIFEELRASSQLIIVTHQKRTMEVADALYGISMRGDGVSSVVSQRLREHESA